MRRGEKRGVATLPAALLLAAAVAGGPLAPAVAAERIGVTSAVNPEAEGTPPQEPTRVLHVGIDMMADEKVTTSANGQAQLLFLDGSAMSIGPNSEVVLDRFVYDPATGAGDLAVTVGRGVFRFVGGRISKQQPVAIRTGTATIGIRGGIATLRVDDRGGVQSGFLFGERMTVTSEGVSQATDMPGTAIDVLPGEPPQPPRILTQAELNATMAAFQGRPSGQGGSGSPDGALVRTGLAGRASGEAPAEVAVVTPETRQPAPAGSRIDSREAAEIVTSLDRIREEIGWVDQEVAEGAAEEEWGHLPGYPWGYAAAGRMMRDPGFTGFDPVTLQVQFIPADSPYLAGWLASGGRLRVATVTGEAYDFPYLPYGHDYDISSAGSVGPFPDFDGRMYVATDGSFWRASGEAPPLAGSQDVRAFVVFGGLQTPLQNIPTSGGAALSLTALVDPFAESGSSSMLYGGGPGVGSSPLYMLYGPGMSYSQRHAGQVGPVGFQAAIGVIGQGSAQRSFLVGATGTLLESGPGTGLPAMSGALRGSLRDQAGHASIALRSYLGSVGLERGTAIYGPAGEYMVINPAIVSANADDSLSRYEGAVLVQRMDGSAMEQDAYLVVASQPAGTPPPDFLQSRHSRTLTGFTGGIGERALPGGGPEVFTFISVSGSTPASGMTISTDAARNTVDVNMPLINMATSTPRVLTFGGEGANPAQPASAFVDDSRYIALETPVPSNLNTGAYVTSQSLVLVSGRAIDSSALGLDLPTCSRCEYLDWGFWSGSVALSDGAQERYHLAAWVAGELPDLAQIPTAGTASYAGSIVGNVLNQGMNYLASGQIGVQWDFAQRYGSFQVTGFDATNYAGSVVSTDGRQIVGGGNSTDYARDITLLGSFFAGGGDPAAAMAGNFMVEESSGNYAAGGVWVAGRTP